MVIVWTARFLPPWSGKGNEIVWVNSLGQQRLLHRCYPTVKYSRHRSGLTRWASSAKIRLLSGQNCLAEHLHRIKFKASPNCPCGSDRQDTNHIILHCPSLLDQRNSLVNDIDYLYSKHNVPPYKRSMSLIDILTPQHDMKTNTEIDHAFSKFIQNCPFKIWPELIFHYY